MPPSNIGRSGRLMDESMNGLFAVSIDDRIEQNTEANGVLRELNEIR